MLLNYLQHLRRFSALIIPRPVDGNALFQTRTENATTCTSAGATRCANLPARPEWESPLTRSDRAIFRWIRRGELLDSSQLSFIPAHVRHVFHEMRCILNYMLSFIKEAQKNKEQAPGSRIIIAHASLMMLGGNADVVNRPGGLKNTAYSNRLVSERVL